MGFTKSTVPTNDISNLPTRPTISAIQLQNLFDNYGANDVTYVNDLIDEMEAITSAGNLGATPITDLDGSTIQTILASLRNKLKSITDGSSGADFVKATSVSGLTGTTIQSLIESLKSFVDSKEADIDAHIADLNNPHAVTRSQLDVYSTSQVDTKDLAIQVDVDANQVVTDAHIANAANPHVVTNDQVDAYNKAYIDALAVPIGEGVLDARLTIVEDDLAEGLSIPLADLTPSSPIASTSTPVENGQAVAFEVDGSFRSNLFNKNTGVVEGSYLDSTGNIVVNALYFYDSDYVKVKPSTTYTVSSGFSINTYDTSKVWESNITTATFTTLATQEYIRASGLLTELDTFMIEEGTVLGSYIQGVQPIRNVSVGCVGDISGNESRYTHEGFLAEGDKLTGYVDGTVEKYKKNEFIELDGEAGNGWFFESSKVGFKLVRFEQNADGLNNSDKVTKYDNSILINSSVTTFPDRSTLISDGAILYISIADTDSGWGETYTPLNTGADLEINAMMNMWVMHEADNSIYDAGTKYWSKRYQDIGTPLTLGFGTVVESGTAVTVCPTTKAYGDITQGYKMFYELANPVTETVMSGNAVNTFSDEINTFSVESGMVYGELSTPVLDGGYYKVNDTTLIESTLNKKVKTINKIIKETFVDGEVTKSNDTTNWTIDTTTPYGVQRAIILEADYDTTANYLFDYENLHSEYDNQQANASISYKQNTHDAIDSLNQNQNRIDNQVSENTKRIGEQNLINLEFDARITVLEP